MLKAMKRFYFVTGTDTGVGKTAFCMWLLRQWREAGKRVIGLKPFATGDRGDAEGLMKAAAAGVSVEEVNPFFWETAAAPYFASLHEGKFVEIDFKKLAEDIDALLKAYDCGLVEGAGGWRVPITEEIDIARWAKTLGLPVIVVARNALGTVNHTLLSVERILSDGLSVRAVILNDYFSSGAFYEDWHAEWIRKETGVEVFRWTREGVLLDALGNEVRGIVF
jgi:dethiobiotin synthetase